MKTEKKLGIWMDYSNAHLMEFTHNTIETKNIESDFTHEVKEAGLNKSEKLMHNKEQGKKSEYFKIIGKIIEKYDEIIIFGPTDAKSELFNILKSEQNFNKIKIKIEDTDKMTDNQEHAYVKEYFSKI